MACLPRESTDRDAPINGFVIVSYDSIRVFTITHGKGTSCNPDEIEICGLEINRVLAESQSLGEIILFPNPTQNESHIANTFDVPLELEIFNMLGQLISRESVYADSTKRLDVSQYAGGVYLLQFISEGDILALKRLLIQR